MELESLVDELTLADAGAVEKAVRAAAGLASVDPCLDERVLEVSTLPPKEDREAIRAVRYDITRAGNLERAGRYTPALGIARSALKRAEQLEWPPLLIAAQIRLGRLLGKTEAHEEAETILETAYFEAAKTMNSESAFDAAQALAFTVGYRSARPADGRRWGRLADVALSTIRDNGNQGQASLLHTLGTIDNAAGDYPSAKANYEKAVAIAQQSLGPNHPLVATHHHSLANVLTDMGEFDEAAALFKRTLAAHEAMLGGDHPLVAFHLNNLANIYIEVGA